MHSSTFVDAGFQIGGIVDRVLVLQQRKGLRSSDHQS
jgi:hypothetical protein